ncbi:SOS response-associated peptidase [Paenibacillus sp. JX-17]|uniref:Abasic site processing protein n=1 Tax=Paenibacillus lacisoli TaxID=3064525 RepID=A0ABT9CDK3_9BACL|nr:SOS response-associated peptidase [Paenibacillus sp. JX-17]MDO7905683.1 SOS response-associated peptidase [Paenibacillus sp. JX-17]
MCNRYSLSADLDDIRKEFGIRRSMYYYKTRYNMSPTQHIPMIMHQEGERVLDEFRWGFVPYWGKDCVHADLQTVHRNPTYRKMVETRRCIIPCDGLYYRRWQGKRSYMTRAVRPDGGMFAIAGLYEVWYDSRKEPMRTCTMLMAPANPVIAEFNTRMPAILQGRELEQWLNPAVDSLEELLPLLRSDEQPMRLYPVTPLVENDSHDHEECVQEMDLKQAWVK